MSTTGRLTTETVSAEVIKLDNDFFPTPWSQEQWRELDLNFHTLLGWRIGEELSGFALFGTLPGDDTAHLLKILLLDQKRGTGTSQIFWSGMASHLKSLGFRSVYLEVEAGNLRAQGFYEKVGFLLLRRNKGYYSNGEDALIMTLTL